jgi:dTDP-4-amino-4,6-dideoxygalactose transaminase
MTLENKKMFNPSLPFSPPSYTDEEVKNVETCLRNGWTGSGPMLKEFETKFANYKGVSYAAGFSSCTSALFLSLKALGVGPGDEVITTAMTFCSTVNIIIHCGATPVLCDVDPFTKNISTSDLQKKISFRTKVIIPVHYAGYPCDMTTIMEIANKNHIYVVEDCAHAIEAKHRSQMCGSFGDIGCFSFYATKNIAIGEGGMAISSHENLIQEMSTLGLHGLSRDAWRRFNESKRRSYDVVQVGFKMNLTDIQSAIGIVQLSRLSDMFKRRVQLWSFYNSELIDLGLDMPMLPSEDSGDVHALHLYTIGLPKEIDRDHFVWLSGETYAVTMGIHYNSIPTFSIYKKMQLFDDPLLNYPVAYNWGKCTVSLSLSAAVSDSDAERVVDAVKNTLKTISS